MNGSSSLFGRMLRAAMLQSSLYEEVEADRSATSQAAIVVIIVSIATGIGAGIAGLGEQGGLGFVWGLLIGIVTSLLGWLVWSGIVYIIGTTILKGEATSATWGECLRTIGFANSPGVLRIFSFIPFIGGVISFAVFVWILIASVIAVRQALDISTLRAFFVALIGWIIQAIIYFVFQAIFVGVGSLF